MWQHHLIVEGRRRGARVLIAGIREGCGDQWTGHPATAARTGWRFMAGSMPGGKPIQPVVHRACVLVR